jgi:hypothetical protein
MWIMRDVGGEGRPIINLSGGTELFGCFLLPSPVVPLKPSTLWGPGLGMGVDVFDDNGMPVRGERGYLVARKPAPSMTRGLWKDPRRYIEVYWSRFPGVWYHGDYALIDEEGFWYILGRAMHVKGLEISAYDCHVAPAMALAYGTSPIGAHHKDAWIIAWEVRTGRFEYNEAKVDKLIEMQRIRGGIFETMVGCRFPWVELGFNLEWYLKVYKAVTGYQITFDEFYEVADRVYTLIRALWIRELKGWSIDMDTPPMRWFKEPLTKGPLAGGKLDYDKYLWMLRNYYEKRGWDERGVPRESTLRRLKLDYTIGELSKYVSLQP